MWCFSAKRDKSKATQPGKMFNRIIWTLREDLNIIEKEHSKIRHTLRHCYTSLVNSDEQGRQTIHRLTMSEAPKKAAAIALVLKTTSVSSSFGCAAISGQS